MFLNEQQLRDIRQIKVDGNRSLEQNVVDTHRGDQTILGDGSRYRYLNRPLPQATQTVHLLYPTIDSGSVFLTETPMNPEWHYTRQDIPNVAASQDEVLSHRKASFDYHVNDVLKAKQEKLLERKLRHLPIYDQPFVPGDSLPGIYSHNHPDSPIYVDGVMNNREMIHEEGSRTTPKGGGVEYFTHLNGDSEESNNLGRYGYPQPTTYANMGQNPYTCGYKTEPKAEKRLPHVIHGGEIFEGFEANTSEFDAPNETNSDKELGNSPSSTSQGFLPHIVIFLIVLLVILGLIYLLIKKTNEARNVRSFLPYAHTNTRYMKV